MKVLSRANSVEPGLVILQRKYQSELVSSFWSHIIASPQISAICLKRRVLNFRNHIEWTPSFKSAKRWSAMFSGDWSTDVKARSTCHMVWCSNWLIKITVLAQVVVYWSTSSSPKSLTLVLKTICGIHSLHSEGGHDDCFVCCSTWYCQLQLSVVKLNDEYMLHHCQKLDQLLYYLGLRLITETIDQRNGTWWWVLWAFSFPFHSDIGKQHHCCRLSAQTYFGGWMLVAPLTPTQNSLSSKTTNIVNLNIVRHSYEVATYLSNQ